MAAIAYDAPRPYPTTREKTFPRGYANAASGQSWDTGNFVVLTTAGLALCSNNALSVTGLSDHPSGAVFGQYTAGQVTLTSIFGAQMSTAVQPFAPGDVDHYCPAANNQQFEISLKETYLLTMNGIQSVGITVDPTTSFWIASTALSNAATIIRALYLPGQSLQGNTGQRVIIQFQSASVVGS